MFWSYRFQVLGLGSRDLRLDVKFWGRVSILPCPSNAIPLLVVCSHVVSGSDGDEVDPPPCKSDSIGL